MDTADELLVTELMFNGEVAQVVQFIQQAMILRQLKIAINDQLIRYNAISDR